MQLTLTNISRPQGKNKMLQKHHFSFDSESSESKRFVKFQQKKNLVQTAFAVSAAPFLLMALKYCCVTVIN